MKMSPLRFLDVYSRLPSTAPVGFPHIIDQASFNEDTDQGSLRAADGIATTLYHWKPEALDAFLDMSNDHVQFLATYSDGDLYMLLFIRRTGPSVIVSA